MKVTFVANPMNHHQLPFCRKMIELTNGQFTYISVEPLSEEQSKLGYANLNMLDFIIRYYEDDVQKNEAMKHILEDDMVIFGSCPDSFLERRRDTGRPFIIYSERFFKKGIWRRFIPITKRKIYKRILQFEGANMSVICSSAYLPYDLYLLKANFRTYKWGYFPPVKHYDLQKLLEEKGENKKTSILWVGRLIKWKHPDASICVAKMLKDRGYSFELNIVGDGPLRKSLEQMVKKYGLENEVCFCGATPATQVRSYMERANIFLFTSDYNEGWGAVMNEAMNSGCAVIASHAVGSVPFLVKDGYNGLVYKSGDVKQLFRYTKQLMDSTEIAQKLSKNAYETIVRQWNADNAATRLYKIISAKLNKENDVLFEEGPGSLANIIKPKYGEKYHDQQ